MNWTTEQEAVLDHPQDSHAVVRAAPGAGKTTLLVGRVHRLIAAGVDPARIRVVMFNKAIRETFIERLLAEGNMYASFVTVTTFDALGLEVLRAARDRNLLSKPLQVESDLTTQLARQVFRLHMRGYNENDFKDAEEIERAVGFWKAHLITPHFARFPTNPEFVTAYREFEALRRDAPTLRVGFEDMVGTAVAVLRAHPGVLGPVDHLLVDEFQDVNPGRVELMRLLIHETTSVMVVGDEDQGINEWCGAHHRYFRDFPQLFPHRPTHQYRLSRTFRFGSDLAQSATRLIAHNVERAPGVIDGGGKMGRVVLTINTLAEVQKLLAAGVPGSDIAVLYRGRVQGSATLAALIGAGVPMNTEDIGLFRGGIGPKTALAYLRAATGTAPIGFEEAWSLAYSAKRYLRKEAFLRQVEELGALGFRAICRHRGVAIRSGQEGYVATSLDRLAQILDRAGRAATAADALSLLAPEIADNLTGRLPSVSEQNAALQCVEALYIFLQEARVTPEAASEAVAGIDARRGLEEGSCVRACTIHAAKGLEWHHVFLPNLVEDMCPAAQHGNIPGTVEHPNGVPQSPWVEQERRIFYVGVTRGIETVYLQAPAPSVKTRPSRFVAELFGNAQPPAITVAPPFRKLAPLVSSFARKPGQGRR